MPKHYQMSLAGIALGLITLSAEAQDASGLLGTWTGTSRAVVSGAGGHYLDSGDGPAFVSADLTIVWSEEDNGRLIGTITSPSDTEPKIAVLSSDGQTLITADADGSSVGRILGENSFELCYTQASEGGTQMAASCVVFERSAP